MPNETTAAVLRAELDALRAEVARDRAETAAQVSHLTARIHDVHNNQNARTSALQAQVEKIAETTVDLVGLPNGGKGRVGHLEGQMSKAWAAISLLKVKYWRLAIVVAASAGAGAGITQLLHALNGGT